MCIVSIFSSGKNDFILTHNRDESHFRPTSNEIFTETINEKEYTAPKDLVSGGTWIFYSEEYVCCILNGEYKIHSHQPPYRKSRGLVLIDLLNYHSIDEFVEKVDLEGIEPFTMIMLNRKINEKKILVWDEKAKHLEDHSKENLIIRSSSPLYTIDEKLSHIEKFKKLKNQDSDTIFKLHKELIMLPNDKFETVQTTSITQINVKNQQIKLKYCPISHD